MKSQSRIGAFIALQHIRESFRLAVEAVATFFYFLLIVEPPESFFSYGQVMGACFSAASGGSGMLETVDGGEEEDESALDDLPHRVIDIPHPSQAPSQPAQRIPMGHKHALGKCQLNLVRKRAANLSQTLKALLVRGCSLPQMLLCSVSLGALRAA